MFSEEEGGYWIHTRGMAEFGRPDYGISTARFSRWYAPRQPSSREKPTVSR